MKRTRVFDILSLPDRMNIYSFLSTLIIAKRSFSLKLADFLFIIFDVCRDPRKHISGITGKFIEVFCRHVSKKLPYINPNIHTCTHKYKNAYLNVYIYRN